MGLKFVDNRAGDKMYYCASCYVYLADKASCVSTNFTGTTGQAYLFGRVVNVSLGPISCREMMTGSHFVRDAFCTHCKTLIGWMYELAPNDKERYKEGNIILERIRILETEGISNDTQLDRRIRRPFDMNNEVVNRIRQGRMRIMQRQHVDRLYNVDDVFRFQQGVDLPVIEIFDEDHIAQTFGYNAAQMASMRDTVERLNQAIASCARGNNADLWILGFRSDIARQFNEIREIMEGGPFRPSRAADHSLMQLFERMRRERERMNFYNNLDNQDAAEFERFFEQRDELNRVNIAMEQARQRRLAAGDENLLLDLYENQEIAPPAPAREAHLRAERGLAMQLLFGRRPELENDENADEGLLAVNPNIEQPPPPLR